MSKYKILKDFQLTTDDKKIVILKAKSYLIDYKYINKDINITMDPIVVENNPDYFQFIDFKTDFVIFLKTNKIAQPSIVAKKILPYIEENFKTADTPSNSMKEVIILEQELAATKTELVKSHKEIGEMQSKFDLAISKNDDVKNDDVKKYTKEVDFLKSENHKLSITNDQLSEKNGELILSIKKLELQLSKTSNTKEIEDEMLTALNDINDRLTKVMDRENKVAMDEIKNASSLTVIIEEKNSNDRDRKEIYDLDIDIQRRLSEIQVREAQLKMIDTQTLIDNAIADYEKGIPWQYHRDKK